MGDDSGQRTAAIGLRDTIGKVAGDSSEAAATFHEATASISSTTAHALQDTDEGLSSDMNGLDPQAPRSTTPRVENQPAVGGGEGGGAPGTVRDNFHGGDQGDDPKLGEPGQEVPQGTTPGAQGKSKDPVDLVSGEMFLPQTDLTLPGILTLMLERMHRSSYEHGRLFGRRWASTLDQRIEVDANGVHYAAADGRILHYAVPIAPGQRMLPAEGARWPLTYDRGDDVYRIEQPEDGFTLSFPPGPTAGARLLRSVVDRNGNRITFEYDGDGVPTDVFHSGGYHVRVDSIETRGGLRVSALKLADLEGGPDTGVLRFDYDLAGRLVGTVNSSGQALVFEYDEADRITGWIDRNGYRFDYCYRADGRVDRAQGEGGFLSAGFQYDLERRITRLTDAVGAVSEHHYDERGRVFKRIDPLGGITLVEHDRYGNVLSSTDALGRVTRVERNGDGNPVRLIRPDGGVVEFEYNALRLATRVTGPDGAVWRNIYDERGNLTQAMDPVGAVTSCEYDQRGALTQVTDALGHTTRFTCNAAGLALSRTDPLGAVTRVAFDAFGRVISAVDPSGAETRTAWSVEGEMTACALPDGSSEAFEYDAEGNLLRHTGPAGAVTTFEYGPFDVAMARTDPDGAVYRFAYDGELRLKAVTSPANLTWSYTYDERGRLNAERDFNGSAFSYELDAAGEVIARVNSLGERQEFERDELGRVTTRRLGAEEHRFAYDAAGRVMRAERPGVVVEYGRDALGRVVSETVAGRSTGFTYDAIGQRLARTTPEGIVTQWTYDAAGSPLRMAGTGGELTFQYDAAGRETARALGAAAWLTQSYDVLGRLAGQEIVAPNGSGPREQDASWRALQSRTYAYRMDGTPLEITDTLRGTRSFDLDPLGRVTAVQAATWRETYAYDALGNLAHAAHPGQDADTEGAREHQGTLTRRAGRSRYEHDQAGRLTRRVSRTLSGKERAWTYQWDGHDQLIRATNPDGETWQYAYDALGRRVAKARFGADGQAVDTVWFTWDGSRLAEQTTTLPDGRITALAWDYEPETHSVVAQTRLTWADGAPQSEIDAEFHAIVTDQVGTPTELVSADGQVAWYTTTSLWGQTITAPESTTDCPLRYPGQYHDRETGLDYNYFRYYSAADAAYLTPDPLGLPAAPNNHAYVDNPLAWIDPLGLASYKVVHENDAGRFGDLNPGVPGDGLEAHHMPQDGLGHLARNEGGAVVMKAGDHALTRTYKSAGRATKAAEAGLPFRTVLRRDIADLRRIGRTQYGDRTHFDPGIRKLLAYYKSIGML